ncbi:CmpA/NrtA family ABC transporter substrate-binding protein [Aliiglaciecola sp. SL4]|uniref:CmpA/NrtA family ABC transporter substrate-binding protein n=1 Tax=Aliiglaciecola sp. SL4 TaxID=3239806 RepID=UPI00355C7D37
MMKLEKTQLTLGFSPLTDCAPFVVAKNLGYFEHWGLDVTLQKQNSWATLRDKLHAGVLDAAQMLAPMPIASTLGLGVAPIHVVTPMVLSQNGNGITLSEALVQELLSVNNIFQLEFPLDAKLLKNVIDYRIQQNKSKLSFATVFPYSCHHYQLKDWLLSGGITFDDVNISVVPPINMVDTMLSGDIDGFCVGGPWNAKAVRGSFGATVVTSSDIWQDSPEKVLGFLSSFVETNPNTVLAVCAALKQSCIWLDSVPNRFETAVMMSQQGFLGEPLEVITPSLLGSCLTQAKFSPRSVPSYNQFSTTVDGNDVNNPDVEYGQWLLQKIQSSGQIPDGIETNGCIERIYRSDIYAQIAPLLEKFD